MSQGGGRPGGLTALAVINFIFFAFSLIGIFGLLFMVAVLSGSLSGEEFDEIKAEWDRVGLTMGIAVLSLVTTVASGFLLLLSGIGYLGQRQFLGRTLGSAYGVLGVVTVLVNAMLIPAEGGGGFGISQIIGLIYPVLTP